MKNNPTLRFAIALSACALALSARSPATAQVLQHRYSFFAATNNAPTAVDLVGTNDGTLFSDAVIMNGQLQLDGNAYVQLPPGIITNDLAVTVEVWGDYPALSGQSGWANLFDFGTQDVNVNDSYSISFCVDTLNPAAELDAAISDYDNANVNRENCFADANLIAGVTGAYVAAVFNPPGGYIGVYVNGSLVSEIPIISTITPGVRDVDNWIGKDNWPDPDMIANLDEFRIWNGALSSLQIAASYQSGPSTIDTNAGSITSLQLQAGPTVVRGGQESAKVLATASSITNTVDITTLASYSSGNTNIITVSSAGIIHGVALGSATVTASYGGQTNSTSVTVVEPIAVMAHRYSFNDPGTVVKDSIGTLDGNLEGTAYETNGQVVLDGTVGTYVDLSSNAFANAGIISGYSSATIDFWGTFGTMGFWSYAWSFGNEPSGNGGVDFLYFTINGGNGHYLNDNNQYGVNLGGNFNNETIHCTTVCDPNTGIWAIYTNGGLNGYITNDFVPLNIIATNLVFIGRSLWTVLGPPAGAGDPYTIGSFDEFRVYNGSLTAQEVAMADQNGPNNTNINPGTLQSLTLQVPSTAQWLQAIPVALIGHYSSLSNWNILGNSISLPQGLTVSSSDTNVLTVVGNGQALAVGLGSATITVAYQGLTNSQTVTVLHAPPPTLTHRYSFSSGTPNDSIGTANGVLVGAATISGGQLLIPNATTTAPASDYLQLPDGILTNSVNGIGTNNNDPSVTIEAWGTIYTNQYTWANLFDFGNQDGSGAAEYDIHVCVNSGAYLAPGGSMVAGISDSDNANGDYQYVYFGTGAFLDGSTNIHITAVFNPPAGYLALYTNGVLIAENYNITISMAGVWAALNKIGADNWPDPGFQGSISEFRIYNGVLDPDQVALTQVLGPGQLLPSVSLTATVSGANVVISWPVSGSSGFLLYSSKSLLPGATWTSVTNTPTIVGQNYQVTIPSSGGPQAQFYRLKN